MLLIPFLASVVLGWALARTHFCLYRATDLTASKSLSSYSKVSLVLLSLSIIHGLLMLFFNPEIAVNRYGFKTSMWVGCLLFALGVWVNRACTWGTLVQLGERNWTYLFTLVGMYFGVVSDSFWGKALDPMRVSGLDQNPWQSGWTWIPVLLVFALVAYTLRKRKIQWPAGAYLPWVSVMIAALVMTYSGMGLFTNNGIRFITSTRDDAWVFGICAALVVVGAVASAFPSKSVQLKWKNIPRHFLGGVLMGIASFMIPGGTEEWVIRDMPFLLTQGWIALFSVAVLLFLLHMIFSRHRHPSESAV